MKFIKITDFLELNNKPKKFKYKNYIWTQPNNMNIYVNEENIDFETYLASVQICDLGRLFSEVLNDEVEIIEDKPKKIEELDNRYYDEVNQCFGGKKELGEPVLVDKINEVIDKLNYLLEKSNKE